QAQRQPAQRQPSVFLPSQPFELQFLSWMMLSEEQRRESPEYREIVAGRAVPAASWQLFRLFAPGSPRLARFRVWRARQPGVATTVAQLTVGPSSLTWQSCDGPSLEHRPGPLPPFEVDTNFGEPSMQWLPAPLGTIQEDTIQTTEFGYGELVFGPLPSRPVEPKPSRPRYEALFRWQQDGIDKTLATTVDIQRFDDRFTRLWIEGGAFAARLALTSGRDRAKAELELQMSGRSTSDATGTLDLLDAVASDQGAGLEVNGNVWKVADLEASAIADASAWRERIEQLCAIEAEFGVPLTIPDDDDDESWMSCAFITTAMRDGGVVVRPRRAQFTLLLPDDAAAQLPEPGPVGDAVALDRISPWKIGLSHVDIGTVRITMLDAQLVSKTPIERDGQRGVEFSFVCEVSRYEFARWLRD
ncbi:MAG: hypothetical protein NT062_11170, partial [Proteobacteria bacterium]|nr:hypothetical protein [Pseudomonadota bacterium]